MSRPLRLEYPGALYHVTARGARQDAIFVDDGDRASLLAILARTVRACDAQVFAYCLMNNHYHFVLRTRLANLAVLMRRLNSVYCLTFNRRHARLGHVFEGRYKAHHVDRDAYLLEVCRYVDLNPVRARLVESPGRWAWSSYRALSGLVPAPPWLACDEVRGVLVGAACEDRVARFAACRRYAEWVDAGREVRLWRSLRQGVYLGDDAFVERVERACR